MGLDLSQQSAILTHFGPMYGYMGIGKRLRNTVRRFFSECLGPTATEYAVLLVLVVFGCLSAISLLGAFLSSSMQSTAEALPGSAGGGAASDSNSDQKKTKKKRKKPSRRRRRRRGGRSGKLQGTSRSQEHYVLAGPGHLGGARNGRWPGRVQGQWTDIQRG